MIWLKSVFWPLKQIDAALPKKGVIFDLGCGDGLVSAYLAHHSPQRRVIGIDINHQKLRQAAKLIHQLPNLKFKQQDILRANLRPAAGCVITDVIHHLSLSNQLKLLTRISKQLKPGSICVIKEVNRQNVVRSRLTRLWDWLLYPHDQIHFWFAPELINTMKKLGFTVKFTPITPWFPGSVNLFTCTKL